MSLPTRTLGTGAAAVDVSLQGLGGMGMSMVYGTRDDVESTATLNKALDLGVTFWDTADVYGPHHNEELIGKVLQTRRDEVVLATKFANHLVDGKMTITLLICTTTTVLIRTYRSKIPGAQWLNSFQPERFATSVLVRPHRRPFVVLMQCIP